MALTKEQTDAMVAALKRERDGYELRIAALLEGKIERLSLEQLEARVAAVDEQLAYHGVKRKKAAEPGAGGAPAVPPAGAAAPAA